MSQPNLGQLIPLGGGDPIPMIQEIMTVGRRESCDICLKYQNVSGLHCEFVYANGVWSIKDLKSSNGVKVNGGERLLPNAARVLRNEDEISISAHKFTIHYTPTGNIDELADQEEDLFSRSLMEKAGLEKPKERP